MDDMACDSSSSKGVLSPVPSEVLDIIIDNLPRKDILACLGVNSFFYATIRPRKCFRIQLRPGPDGSLTCIGVHDKPGEHGGDGRLPSFTHRWIPNLVQCLEVFPHQRSSCYRFAGHSRIKNVGLKPPWGTIIPNIVRIKLTPTSALAKRGLHADERAPHMMWLRCSALEASSPYTFVCNFWDVGEGPSVTRAVFIAKRTFKASKFLSALSLDMYRLIALEDITIVLACGGEDYWTPTTYGLGSNGGWRKWLKRIARSFVRRFCPYKRSRGQIVTVTLVNTSGNSKQAQFEDKADDSTLRTTQDSIHRFMVDCSLSFSTPYTRDYDRKDFEDLYRVVSLEEFVASSPGVLAPEDVGEWL